MWLRLTLPNGSPIVVNMDMVISAEPSSSDGTTLRTSIIFAGNTHNIDVQEKISTLSALTDAKQ